MHSLSFPSAITHFFLGDSKDLRPIISIKETTPEDIKEDFHSLNEERSKWSYLTLGIPKIIKSLSIFSTGIIHREKLGLALRVRFKDDRLPSEKVDQLIKFHKFNQISPKPMNDAVYNKALYHMNLLINQLEIAKTSGNASDSEKFNAKMKAIAAVIEKNSNPKMTRSYFDECDWSVVDQLEYELICEYFDDLTDLFNTDWMISSDLKKTINVDFGINYQESVVAESLALAFSYIEGLEGKTIKLPLFIESTGKYESIQHTIKQITIGDALPCYILESENPKFNPWFIVRGTQPYIGIAANHKEYRIGGLESFLADALDPECISRNVINKSLVHRPIVNENGQFIQKENLSDIFRKWREEGKFVMLSGHSLGGTIVNAITVEFIDQIKLAYAFSAAGVSFETASRWKQLCKQSSQKKLDAKLINFDYEGDIVPSGGCKLIGTHLAIQSLLQIGPNGLYDCHVRTHLNHDFQIQKIDVKKESHKVARLLCERLRIVIGKCLLLFLWAFNHKYLPDWWKNRKVYRERAEFERSIRFGLVNA